MRYHIVLAKGTNTLSRLAATTTTDNNFAEAAVTATVALWGNSAADNVSVYRELDNGTVADEYFFYAEKD